MLIEAMTDAHADIVLAIYQAGMDEGNATFEISAPAWDEFTATRLPAHRYVATGDGRVPEPGNLSACARRYSSSIVD
jgi:L-amino acid N-acyltransferase YncA